jgi:hypothetical protein
LNDKIFNLWIFFFFFFLDVNYNYKTLVEAEGNIPNYGYYTFLVGDNNPLTTYSTTFSMDGTWDSSAKTSDSIMIMRNV